MKANVLLLFAVFLTVSACKKGDQSLSNYWKEESYNTALYHVYSDTLIDQGNSFIMVGTESYAAQISVVIGGQLPTVDGEYVYDIVNGAQTPGTGKACVRTFHVLNSSSGQHAAGDHSVPTKPQTLSIAKSGRALDVNIQGAEMTNDRIVSADFRVLMD